MSSNMNRREFFKLSAATAAMLGLVGHPLVSIAEDAPVRKPKPIAAGKKIRIAQIGFGGKGSGDVQSFKDAEIVALCDVDWTQNNVGNVARKFPDAKRYRDFRQMLLEMDDQIDAVAVATPDFMHFLPAYMAITMGKHVYVQKPLTQTIWEARELLKAARKHGVCTQMGNQGHAGEGCRLVKEWIAAGVVGGVTKVDVWTNRPVWPQGMTKAPDSTAEPKGMAWDNWLGREKTRPYSSAYHPFKWRGWADFGAGALGDMGCHILDAPFFALELGTPTSVTAEASGPVSDGFPSWSIVTYEFPARGAMPPVTLKWYDGGKSPERPKELEASRQLAKGGLLVYGDKGVIYDPNDYCNSPRLIPEAKMKEAQPTLPAKTIRRPNPVGNPYLEWMQAIEKNDPSWAGSNFEYSVRLTEFVLLGNLALRAPGKKIQWDAEKMEVSNVSEVNQFVKPNFREGWAVADLADSAQWSKKTYAPIELPPPAAPKAGKGKGQGKGGQGKGGQGKGGQGQGGQGKGQGRGKKKAQTPQV